MSCAFETISFQNLFQVLKTCTAGRKYFFDTLQTALSVDTVHRKRGFLHTEAEEAIIYNVHGLYFSEKETTYIA